MKAVLVSCLVVVLLVLCEPVSAGIITQWDFESTTSNDPSIGNGSYWLEGTATWTGPVTLDTVNIITYSNGIGAGTGWAVSTAGYENINISIFITRWDGFSGSRDWTWSYFDGTTWIDGPDFHVDSHNTGDTETFDLTAVAGAANNADFKFRVTRTTDMTYNSLTTKFDNVTISGTPIPEPATMTMLIGTALLCLRRRNNK